MGGAVQGLDEKCNGLFRVVRKNQVGDMLCCLAEMLLNLSVYRVKSDELQVGVDSAY